MASIDPSVGPYLDRLRALAEESAYRYLIAARAIAKMAVSLSFSLLE